MSQRYHPIEKWYETKSFNKTNWHGPWNVYHVVNYTYIYMKTYQHSVLLICIPSCLMSWHAEERRTNYQQFEWGQLVCGWNLRFWNSVSPAIMTQLLGHLCLSTLIVTAVEKDSTAIALSTPSSGGEPLSSGIDLNIFINQAISLIKLLYELWWKQMRIGNAVL